MTKYQRDCYVPIVAKNKDYLVGFLDALFVLSPIVQVDSTLLDSMRYTDYLPNNQRRVDLEEDEIAEILSEHKKSLHVKENGIEKEVEELHNITEEDVLDYKYLEVHCTCGNYYSFESAKNIPEHSMDCDLCGRRLIDYTDIDEREFEYRGDLEKMFIGTIAEEMEDFEDEDDSEFDSGLPS